LIVPGEEVSRAFVGVGRVGKLDGNIGLADELADDIPESERIRRRMVSSRPDLRHGSERGKARAYLRRPARANVDSV
jgi:hypothetical protein